MISLDYINDLLIDYLPYEIDDNIIRDLLSDIANLKILKKKDIFFYKGMDSYDIWNDSKGIKIILGMIEYYKQIDKSLSINSELILYYFKEFRQQDYISRRIEPAKEFLEEFNMQDKYKTYTDYIKAKITNIKYCRFFDSNYNYKKNRTLNIFEEYLCDNINYKYYEVLKLEKEKLVLEENPNKFDNLINLSKYCNEIKQAFSLNILSVPNQIYELNQIFSSIDINSYSSQELRNIFGSIISLNNKINLEETLQLLGKVYTSDNYEQLLLAFKTYNKELKLCLKDLTPKNYNQKLKDIQTNFNISTERIIGDYDYKKYLNDNLSKKLMIINTKEKEAKKIKEGLNLLNEFIDLEVTIKDFCTIKNISQQTFNTLRQTLADNGYDEVIEKINNIINKQKKSRLCGINFLISNTVKDLENNQDEFDLLTYSLKTKVDFLSLPKLALSFNKLREANIISNYIDNNSKLFKLYDKRLYINKYQANDRTYCEADHLYLMEYLHSQQLESYCGIVDNVLNKLFNGEALPARNNKIYSATSTSDTTVKKNIKKL